MTTRIRECVEGQYGYIPISLIAFISYTTGDALAQYTQTFGIPTGQILLVRFCITAFLCAIYLVFRPPNHPIPLDHIGLIILRSFLDTTGTICSFQAFLYLMLSEAVTIIQLRPFAVGLLCFVFLREAFTWRQVIACSISIAAVMLVVQPDFFGGSHADQSQHHTLGSALVFSGVCLQAVGATIIRTIGEINLAVVLLPHSVCGCTVSSLWLFISQQPLVRFSVLTFVLTLIVTFWGICAQLFYVAALQRAEGSKVACLSYIQIIWSVVLQWAFTQIVPGPLALVGMAIIIIIGLWAILGDRADTDANHTEVEEDRVVLLEGGRISDAAGRLGVDDRGLDH